MVTQMVKLNNPKLMNVGKEVVGRRVFDGDEREERKSGERTSSGLLYTCVKLSKN